MNEPFTFYRALDPVKGSWDGYGFFPIGDFDFIVFVADAPSGASIHTPEVIKAFLNEYSKQAPDDSPEDDQLTKIHLADGLNRLQNVLRQRGKSDGAVYQSTLSVARKAGDKLFYFSAGDSILQLYRNQTLIRLNETEIWDGSLIMREADSFKEREKTKSLRLIGQGGEFIGTRQISTIGLVSDDLLFFASDGMEDIVSPRELLGLLRSGSEEMRKELEKLCAPEKLKDDVTCIIVQVKLPASVNVQKEVMALKERMDLLDDHQEQLREGLSRFPEAKIEKLERGVQILSQQLQSLGKQTSSGTFQRTKPAEIRQPEVLIHRDQQKPWTWIAGAFFLGLIIGLGFFLFSQSPQKPAPSQIAATQPASRPAVVPPEIPDAADCSYSVEKGDSLEKIATKKKVTIDHLLRWNPGIKNGTLRIGQKLTVCGDQS